MKQYEKRKNPNAYMYNFYTTNPFFHCTTLVAEIDTVRSLLMSISPKLPERYEQLFFSLKHGTSADAMDATTIQFITNKPRYTMIRMMDEARLLMTESSIRLYDDRYKFAAVWFSRIKHVIRYSKVMAYTSESENAIPFFTPEDPDDVPDAEDLTD